MGDGVATVLIIREPQLLLPLMRMRRQRSGSFLIGVAVAVAVDDPCSEEERSNKYVHLSTARAAAAMRPCQGYPRALFGYGRTECCTPRRRRRAGVGWERRGDRQTRARMCVKPLTDACNEFCHRTCQHKKRSLARSLCPLALGRSGALITHARTRTRTRAHTSGGGGGTGKGDKRGFTQVIINKRFRLCCVCVWVCAYKVDRETAREREREHGQHDDDGGGLRVCGSIMLYAKGVVCWVCVDT